MRHLKWMTKKHMAMFHQTSKNKFVLGASRPAICWSQELASALTTAGQHELTLSLLEAFQSGEKIERHAGKRGRCISKFYIAADSNSNWSMLIRLCWMIFRGNLRHVVFVQCSFANCLHSAIHFKVFISKALRLPHPQLWEKIQQLQEVWQLLMSRLLHPLMFVSLWGDLAQGS